MLSKEPLISNICGGFKGNVSAVTDPDVFQLHVLRRAELNWIIFRLWVQEAG